jgi:RES domain-containing protein
MLVYRISREKFAEDLSGTGARLNGGRWNSVGISMLYTSSFRSLCVLEILVHTTHNFVPTDLRLVTIKLPDDSTSGEIKYTVIKDEIDKRGVNAQFYAIGDKWIKTSNSLILKVPSVIVPEEFNYLINPFHKDLHKVKIENVKPFDIDKRLVK